MKHTPGPWHACGDGKCICKQVWSPDYPIAKIECGKWGDDYPSIRLVGGNLKLKAEPFMDQMTYGEIPEDVAEANARLIAVAPDLLEACKKLMGTEEYDTVNWSKARMSARQAIAKAEGSEP